MPNTKTETNAYNREILQNAPSKMLNNVITNKKTTAR